MPAAPIERSAYRAEETSYATSTTRSTGTQNTRDSVKRRDTSFGDWSLRSDRHRTRALHEWKLESARYMKRRRPRAQPDSQVERIRELVEEWRHDTSHISSFEGMVLHPAYQRIIGFGPTAIPVLLRELQDRPDHWFAALTAITGASPTEGLSTVPEMVDAWLRWGRIHGYL